MHKSARSLLIVAGVVILLLCVKVAINIGSRPDDPKLIRSALADAIQASRDGRPGGVMELLSENLKVNGTDVSPNTAQVQDFIRKQHPNMEVTNPQPLITGDEARIVSPVELDLGILGKRQLPDVTLIFKKEDATDFLIIPTHKWKLTQVRVPDSTIADLVSGAGMP